MTPNANKRFKGLTYQQIAKEVHAKGLPKLHDTTANKYISALSSVLKWAVKETYIISNPAEGLQTPKKRMSVAATAKRGSVDIQCLNQMFQAPIYTGCQDDERGFATPGDKRPRRGRFWVPILSLFHGMRLQECCQLLVSDIKTYDGVPIIMITNEDEADDGDRKRIKNENGVRFVPVHPELLKIGFMSFVSDQKRQQTGRLFPELTAAASDGYLSSNFSKWFNRTSNGFLAKQGLEGKVVFHDLRHTYRDAMRDAGLGNHVAQALGGWASTEKSLSDHYGDGDKASVLAEHIAKIKFDGLNIDHLYQAEVLRLPSRYVFDIATDERLSGYMRKQKSYDVSGHGRSRRPVHCLLR